MRQRWLRLLAIPLVALAAAQIGHVITYVVRFGPGAVGLQSRGGHAYLPALSALLGGAAGAGIVIALLLVALARQYGSQVSSRSGPALINLASQLLLLQLVVYGSQEMAEALANHGALPSATDLGFWGILGQLPAALLVAVVLKRLLTEVEGAIDVLASISPAGLRTRIIGSLAAPAADFETQLHTAVSPRSASLRGPPISV